VQRFFLLLTVAVLFIACGGENDSQTPPSSSYTLSYSSDATQINGQVSFDLGTIPSNHIITLTNFIPVVDGCSVDFTSSGVSPESFTFTSTNTKQNATLDIKLSAPCSSATLVLKAQKKESVLINNKLVTSSKDVTYTFQITKTSTLTNYKARLKQNTLTLTQNKQNENITVVVLDQLNRPAEAGKVSIIYPDIVAQGVDIGSFEKTIVDVKSGEAQFLYTAPNNLKALVDNNITHTSFKFYYNDDIANFVELQINFTPDTNQTIVKSYEILFSPQDNTYKMSLEQSKSFSVELRDEDGNAVADGNISDLNISLENSYIASLMNANGDTNTSFHFTNTNNTTLTLKSKTISGLVPLHISTRFQDINGDTKILNKTFNVIVESGPPTAISISYAQTTQDTQRAKFIEHFAISVTDKYFNPINTRPQVSVGAIVGYAKYSDDTLAANTEKRIYDDNGTATLDTDTLSLNQNYLDANTTLDLVNDTLVTFGAGYTYPASGAWAMRDYNSSAIFLSPGQYDGNATQHLGFAIGHNFRQDACNFGDEWLGQAKLQNNESTIDETGTAIVELSYDYYLVGKDILLYINIIGKDNKLNKEIKIGEVKKHTLRGVGITSGSDTTITAKDGATVTKRFYAWISQTPNALRNARFVFTSVTASGDGHINTVSRMPIQSCQSGGHAYVEYNITADANATYSVSVSKPELISEF